MIRSNTVDRKIEIKFPMFMIIWQVVSVTAKNVEGRSLPCQFDNFTALRQVSEKCARFASMFCQACFWQNIFLF